MKKVAAFAVDDSPKYQRLLLGVIASFRRFHGDDWTVRVYSVEAGKDFTNRLRALGCDVRNAPRTNPIQSHSNFPCSAAKCLALVDIQPGELIITLDADGLILTSLDPLVEEFLVSGADIAMLPERNEHNNFTPVRECWFGCPLEEFKYARAWMEKPILNAGMILARGDFARCIGEDALRIVMKYEETLYLGEQGPINGVVYDQGYRLFPLTPYHHCRLIDENLLTFSGIPYIGEVRVDGHPIVYRHFGGTRVNVYQTALDCMLAPEGTEEALHWRELCLASKSSRTLQG